MINRICLVLLVFLLSACALPEEFVLEEPIIADEVANAEPIADCNSGDDDGIGGTGCEPVARAVPNF